MTALSKIRTIIIAQISQCFVAHLAARCGTSFRQPQTNIPFPSTVCGQYQSISALGSPGLNASLNNSGLNSANRRVTAPATSTVSAFVNAHTE